MIRSSLRVSLLTAAIFSFSACSLFHRHHDKPATPPSTAAKKTPPKVEESQLPLPKEPMAKQATNLPELPWDYSKDKGPQKWGELSSSYVLCKTGDQQSPIDLVYKKPHTNRPIIFKYHAGPLKVVNTGTTVLVNFEPGSEIIIGHKHYELISATFHSSSEHTIAGNHLPMEMELMHRSSDGHIAIVSVILIEGPANSLIERIWNNIPQDRGSEKVTDLVIDPTELLPARRTYYHYTGSLTTPPCTEGVNWNIFNTPMTLSKEQILTFRHLYSHNNRPVQPLNHRTTVNYK